MNQAQQTALIERFLAARDGALPDHADRSMRNPASAYVGAERFAAEMDLLRSHAVTVALSCELPGPGSWLTVRLGGLPVLIVRQGDGTLAGFTNACRHRGAPLVPEVPGVGHGQAKATLSCPYHAWTYGLDGALRGRPEEWGFADVPAAECSLNRISVAEKHGLVLADARPGRPIDVDAELQGAEAEIATYGLERYVPFETRVREWPFNWKLIVDTFTESYHIPALHRETIHPHYDFRNSVWDAFGLNGRSVTIRNTIAREMAERPREDWRVLPHSTFQYFLLPSTVFTHQMDHVELWRTIPVAVDRTLVVTTLYSPQAADTEKARRYWSRNLEMLLTVTETEDFPMMQQIHERLASGALESVVYGRIEPALSHFHSGLETLLAAQTPSSPLPPGR